MSHKRVVVTGLGTLSCVGNDTKTNWDNLLAGNSGITPIERFDASDYKTRFAGQVKDPSYDGIVKPSDLRRLDDFILYALAATDEAIKDSSIEFDDAKKERTAVYIGSGIGGINITDTASKTLWDKGPNKVSPFSVPACIINMAAGMVSIYHGFTGPSVAVATACTTGAHTIGLGYRSILQGEADIAVAGGSEAPVNPIGLSTFMAARALSTRNDQPEKASRPWDKDRDGFVLAEGAGVMILEDYEHAKARSANIYAEIVGFGMSSDAHHITAPLPNGDGARRSMQNALNDAKVNPADIQYINAHGTSTIQGDLAEIKAVKEVFKNTLDDITVSSTKSMTGHLLGAAGSVECNYTLLAMRDSMIPPTINLDNPDDECDIDLVPHHARDKKIDYALSNSFGFGGTNASLVFKTI